MPIGVCTYQAIQKEKTNNQKKKKTNNNNDSSPEGGPVGGQTPLKKKLPRQLIIVIPNLSFSTMEDVITNIGNIPSKVSGSVAFSFYIQVHLGGPFIKH